MEDESSDELDGQETHPLVTQLLSFGYEETVGRQGVQNAFEAYLEAKDISHCGADEADLDEFLEFFLDLQTGVVLTDETGQDTSRKDLESKDVITVLDEDGEEGSANEESAAEGDNDLISASSSDSDSNAGNRLWRSSKGPSLKRCKLSRLALVQPTPATDHCQVPQELGRTQQRQASTEAGVDKAASADQLSNKDGILKFFNRLPPGEVAKQEVNTARDRSKEPESTSDRRLDDFELANLKVFGHASFRARQREVIEATMRGRDCFVLMPTGGGKSLCFQLPAVLSMGVTVVVSPLLSLMQDQVMALCTNPLAGVPTTYLSSQQSKSQVDAVYNELCKPRPTCKLLYVTPEQLVNSGRLQGTLQALHQRGLLARIVIDEAHCVSMWGHDFRKEYKQLGKVKADLFAGVPTMALTATATDKVTNDILKSLHITRCMRFQVSFLRPNLTFKVAQKQHGTNDEGKPLALEEIADYIRHHRSGIIYCLSRDESERVAHYLEEECDIKAAFYHAGLSAAKRMQVQNKWRSDKIQVVVATIAFGMGIDKPDVRFVIHFTLSSSLEGYYQEAGRAGRDGLPSECVLYYAPRDCTRIIQLLRKPGTRGGFQRGMDLLKQMKEFCEEQQVCRHMLLLRHFGETYTAGRCATACDNCTCPPGSRPDLAQDVPRKRAGTGRAATGARKRKVGAKGKSAHASGSGAAPSKAPRAFVKASSLL